MVGAENVGGAVDQKDMGAFANGLGGNGFCGGGFGECLGHGRNLRVFVANDSVEKADWYRFLVLGLDPTMMRKRLTTPPPAAPRLLFLARSRRRRAVPTGNWRQAPDQK
jgi:hypothetical protein